MKLNDLTGQKFGRLTVLRKLESQYMPCGQSKVIWECRCDCGNITQKVAADLKRQKIPSCGCAMKEVRKSTRMIDLVGQRFGRLVVTERVENSKDGQAKWKCKCDCGNDCIAFGNNLRRGHTTSCGCLNDEKRIKTHTTHGMSDSRIAQVFSHMKDRCNNPNNTRYASYGGRGIKICPEWMNDPESFYKWAYENGYREDAAYGEDTIERIDNNKGYSPENCRIAPIKEQCNNRRTNLFIEHNGERKTLAQWRDYFGMTQSKAYYYLVEKKYTIQDLIDKGIV